MKIVHQFDWNNEKIVYKQLDETKAEPNQMGGFDFTVEDTDGRLYKGSCKYMSTLDKMSTFPKWTLVPKLSKKNVPFHDPAPAEKARK